MDNPQLGDIWEYNYPAAIYGDRYSVFLISSEPWEEETTFEVETHCKAINMATGDLDVLHFRRTNRPYWRKVG